MIDMILMAQLDYATPKVLEQQAATLEQSGQMHSKVAGRFDVVSELPKEADSFNQMFDYADAFGKIKVAYINSAHKISDTPKEEKSATALGGEFGFNTAQLHGFSLHLAAYTSQILNNKNDINEDFTDVNKNSFTYISEASIDYSGDNFQTKIGRLRVETPYANSDDIRMAPNTFEGAWAEIQYTSELKMQLLYINRWAGYDSQDEDALASQNNFKNLVSEDSFGMAGVSLTYEYAKESEVSFWYNHIENMSAITYGEVVGIFFIDGDEFHLDYGLQASNMQELDNSNVDGNVLGAMAIIHYNGAFFGGAYNIALVEDGKYITNGFGGGPYYTSLDEATIAAISEASRRDSEAFRIGGGYDFSKFGINGLSFELVYGELYHDAQKIKEKDAILTYEISDKLNVASTYTHYQSTNNLNDFDRFLVRADYSF